MMTFGELNLNKLRDECGLDFAHFTYQRGQCSCCYGPQDMPAKYWAKGKKPKKIMVPSPKDYEGEREDWDRPLDKVTYILFKNARNGTGVVTQNDIICFTPAKRHPWHVDGTTTQFIEWNFPEEKMDQVLQCLRDQLDDDYVVVRPESHAYCIRIVLRKNLKEEDYPWVYVRKKVEDQLLKEGRIYHSYIYNWRRNHYLHLVLSEPLKFHVRSDHGEYLGTVQNQSDLDRLMTVLQYNKPSPDWWNLLNPIT